MPASSFFIFSRMEMAGSILRCAWHIRYCMIDEWFFNENAMGIVHFWIFLEYVSTYSMFLSDVWCHSVQNVSLFPVVSSHCMTIVRQNGNGRLKFVNFWVAIESQMSNRRSYQYLLEVFDRIRGLRKMRWWPLLVKPYCTSKITIMTLER